VQKLGKRQQLWKSSRSDFLNPIYRLPVRCACGGKKQFTRITPIRFHPSDWCERSRLRIARGSGSRSGMPLKIT
jgi:hypothetical protein